MNIRIQKINFVSTRTSGRLFFYLLSHFSSLTGQEIRTSNQEFECPAEIPNVRPRFRTLEARFWTCYGTFHFFPSSRWLMYCNFPMNSVHPVWRKIRMHSNVPFFQTFFQTFQIQSLPLFPNFLFFQIRFFSRIH